jgi:tRNA dimethylallyltransferase
MTKLIVICGATATGKSSLAIKLAKRLNSIIISADSRQVYREFDIGTAKPTLAEQKLVPHYLIDICNPTETLTLADYQEQAQKLVNGEVRNQKSEIRSQNEYQTFSPTPQIPILVGGTGLYIKSVVKGLKIPRVAPNYPLRSQLQSLGQSQCYAFLKQIDAHSVAKIHPNDAVRTIRALEVFYVTGSPISQQQGENPPNYPILQIGLDCEPSVLQRRIEQRTEQMVEAGLVAEVEALGNKYGWDLPLLNTLGYGEIKQYLAGDISLEKAKELTVLHTRQFAKRQRTWFSSYPEIEWFEATEEQLLNQVWHRVLEFTISSF